MFIALVLRLAPTPGSCGKPFASTAANLVATPGGGIAGGWDSVSGRITETAVVPSSASFCEAAFAQRYPSGRAADGNLALYLASSALQ